MHLDSWGQLIYRLINDMNKRLVRLLTRVLFGTFLNNIHRRRGSSLLTLFFVMSIKYRPSRTKSPFLFARNSFLAFIFLFSQEGKY